MLLRRPRSKKTALKRRILASACGVWLLVFVACGLDISGTSGEPPSTADAASEASSSSETSDASDGGRGSDSSDARVPRCDGSTVTDDLLMFDGGNVDGSRWISIHDSSNTNHPRVDPSPDGPALALINPNDSTSLGAIWLSQTHVIHALDVRFHYRIECPDDGGGPCNDGLAVAWLAVSDAGPSMLETNSSSPTFAIPSALHGGGIMLDLEKTASASDLATPNISILAIDGVHAPGQYDWTTASSAPRSDLVTAHDLSLHVRNGKVEILLDEVSALTGPVATGFPAWFGIAASTGGAPATYFVRSFSATFYECDDP